MKQGNKYINIIGLGALLLLFLPFQLMAQTDRQLVRKGNKQFRGSDFPNSEVSYRKALEKNNRNPQALYNLGNALMAQNKDSAAVEQYQQAAQAEKNPLRKSRAYHNIGFVCQRHQMYGEAIEAYKQSLRLNPDDDETRYNLELCKKLQKEQPQQQQQQQQKEKQEKQDKQDQQQQQQQQKQQQQPPQMSKENAEQLLKAAMQQEKQTQERMKKAQQQPQRRNVQKNW